MTRPQRERAFAVEVVRRLREAGFEALWAGGCVRDELLGLTPKDYDVASSALPEDVRRLFRRTIAVGAEFLVVEVLGPRDPEGVIKVQVATFREEGEYGGRRPGWVVASTAEKDALRRDFTINGMFFDPIEERLIDYVGGRADLEARMLRAIGEPRHRFTEDKLRMLRAVRLAARFELDIEPATTAAAIHEMAAQITVVSPERIADELRKVLVDPHRARGMQLFMDLGLAAPVMPELLPMKGLPQGPPPEAPALPPPGEPGQGKELPHGDLWEHVLRVLDLLGSTPSFPLALAALLHDVGKPRTVGRTPERYTFHGHEQVGARLAGAIAERLRLSNEETRRAMWLVEKHQALCDAPRLRRHTLIPLLAHSGIDELLVLHRADALASGRSVDHVTFCEERLREWGDDVLRPDRIVTGEVLKDLGIAPGPIYKQLLDACWEAQLDRQITNLEEGVRLVQRLLSEWSMNS